MATANVLTCKPAEDGNEVQCGLQVSARREELAQQFADAGLKIVGIHEARSRKARRVTVCQFDMLASASLKGCGGTELWLHEDPHAGLDKPIVQSNDHPHLLATVPLPSGAANCFVTHAPCEPKNDEERARNQSW